MAGVQGTLAFSYYTYSTPIQQPPAAPTPTTTLTPTTTKTAAAANANGDDES